MEPAPRAGRRHSGAAGLRRRRPRLHSSSGAGRPRTRRYARPAAGEAARTSARLRLAPLPPERLRVRTGGAESARCSGRQPRRLSLRAAAAPSPPGFPSRGPRLAPPSRLARRSPPALGSREPGSPAPRLAHSRPRSLRPLLLLLPLAARGDPPRLSGAGTRAPQANHRPGCAAGRGQPGRRSSAPTPPPPPGLGRRSAGLTRLTGPRGGSAGECPRGPGLPR